MIDETCLSFQISPFSKAQPCYHEHGQRWIPFKTAYANPDWTECIHHRPEYPRSLRDVISQYHTRNSKRLSSAARNSSNTSWASLFDVGSGVSISTLPLISDTRSVHLRDPSLLNYEHAWAFLDEYVTRHMLPTKLVKVEDERTVVAVKEVEGGSLAICATAADFIDHDMLVRAIRRTTCPGRSLAIYRYFLRTLPDLDLAVCIAFARATTAAMRLCLGDESTRVLFTAVVALCHCYACRLVRGHQAHPHQLTSGIIFECMSQGSPSSAPTAC